MCNADIWDCVLHLGAEIWVLVEHVLIGVNPFSLSHRPRRHLLLSPSSMIVLLLSPFSPLYLVPVLYNLTPTVVN